MGKCCPWPEYLTKPCALQTNKWTRNPSATERNPCTTKRNACAAEHHACAVVCRACASTYNTCATKGYTGGGGGGIIHAQAWWEAKGSLLPTTPAHIFESTLKYPRVSMDNPWISFFCVCRGPASTKRLVGPLPTT